VLFITILIVDLEKYLQNNGHDLSSLGGTVDKHLSMDEKESRLLEQLSKDKYGHIQGQSNVLRDALEFYTKHLDKSTLTLDGKTPAHKDRNPDFSVRIETGEVIHLEDSVKIPINQAIDMDVPDTYKRRLPVLAAVLRNRHHGHIKQDKVYMDINAVFHDKTLRTKERYYNALSNILNVYERTDIDQQNVPQLWITFDDTFEQTYFDDGLVVGDTETYVSYLVTEIEWQLYQIDEIVKTDSAFSTGKSECIQRLKYLNRLLNFISAYETEFEHPEEETPVSTFLTEKIKDYKVKVNNY
jgi:hypothetical protein